ncbi:MAG: HNH endonuclease [Flavisolibacter sp.]
MAICIICRKVKMEFSDEHVIPDSIKGFYHIYSVCKDCNSNLGLNVDSKLVNHKLMEFVRHQQKIRGKKGALPNPFAGDAVLSSHTQQKVRIEMDEDCNFIPRLLPKIPKLKPGATNFQFSLDKRDAHLMDAIIDKLLG